MRNKTLTLLATTSTLLFVALVTACSTQQSDDAALTANIDSGTTYEIERPQVSDCDPEKIADLADASPESLDEAAKQLARTADLPLSKPLDPETATLEQILTLTRLAMSEVETYKSCQLRVHRLSEGETELRWVKFVEFRYDDHYGFITAHQDDVTSEYRSVGSQKFRRNSRDGSDEWEESVPGPNGPTPNLASEFFRSFLHEDGIELLSNNEVTDAGVAVYRLGDTKIFTILDNSIDVGTQIRSTTVLVDQKTFRLVTGIIEHDYDPLTERNIPGTTTEHYYDYNQPVVIEIPENYIAWTELASLK